MRLSKKFHNVPLTQSAQSVEAFFHISAPVRCPKCTIILAAAVRRALDNSS
jgi:hypothetical protein